MDGDRRRSPPATGDPGRRIPHRDGRPKRERRAKCRPPPRCAAPPASNDAAAVHALAIALRELIDTLNSFDGGPGTWLRPNRGPLTPAERRSLAKAGLTDAVSIELTPTELAAEHARSAALTAKQRTELSGWYLAGGYPLPGLDLVLYAFPRDYDWLDIGIVMTTKQDDLDGNTPKEWLQNNKPIHTVVELIQSLHFGGVMPRPSIRLG